MNFKTLTTYISTKETLPEDKEAIAHRIIRECGLGFADDTVQWVLSHNWKGGEGCTKIIKAWNKRDEPEKQLDRANEIAELGLILSHACDIEEMEIDGELFTIGDIYLKFKSYLDDYKLG